jgi:hypothetical protein
MSIIEKFDSVLSLLDAGRPTLEIKGRLLAIREQIEASQQGADAYAANEMEYAAPNPTQGKGTPDFIPHMGVFWKRTTAGFDPTPYCAECSDHPNMIAIAAKHPHCWMCPCGHAAPSSAKPPGCQNTIIQSLWIGRPLSLIEYLSISSFLQNGHKYHLYCYEEIKNVPPGTTLCDASEILPASQVFRYQSGHGKGSVAAFSNLFRYKLLLERGGWWMDTDVVCLRPLDFVDTVVFAQENRPKGALGAASFAIKLPKGHTVADQCYRHASLVDRKRLRWAEIGPILLNRIVHESGMRQFLKAPDVFCPVDYWKWQSLLDGNLGSLARLSTSDTRTIHLWHELWRTAGLKVNYLTGGFRVKNFAYDLWHQMPGKPKLSLRDTPPFNELLDRYGLHHYCRRTENGASLSEFVGEFLRLGQPT